MIFRRQQPQGLPFESIFICDCIMSDGIIRSDPHGGEYMAPLYINQSQMGIVYERSVTSDTLAVDSIPEHAILGTAGYAGQSAPLFVLNDTFGRRANFDEEKLKELFSEVEQPNKKSRRVYPEDIFDYIYASLHSPSYREKYKEFLKTDFPRIPRPKNWKEFWRLVELGRELRNLHLMEADVDIKTTYPESGSDIVEKVEYRDSKVYINANQYFGNVPELAWNFFIGGYQPAQKWLKDRKGRKLSLEDINHYQKIIAILLKTDALMKKIG